MKEKLATAEQLRPLYALMDKIKTLAPWNHLEESDIFGVQHPVTGEIGFVSIMGMAGEHFAISVYQGTEALFRLLAFMEAGPFASPQELLEIPQLQASFEDRDMLEPEDRAVLKSLGVKYRGQNAWPMFRSYRPGFAPYFVVPEEAEFLTCALEQVLKVAPRASENPDLLVPDENDDLAFLVRVASMENGLPVWRDEVMRIPPPNPKELVIVMDQELFNEAKRLLKKRLVVEADFFMTPAQVGKKGERPAFSYMLMLVDAASGMVLGFDLLGVETTLEAMWGQLALATLNRIMRLGSLPSEMRVRDPILHANLVPLAKELGFKLRQQDELPRLDDARDSLAAYLG